MSVDSNTVMAEKTGHTIQQETVTETEAECRRGADRREAEELPPHGVPERRFRAERRGIMVTESDFDEHIELGVQREKDDG